MSESLVDRLIDGLIEREGGYVNHPADRGGPTNYGITLAVARANGYVGAMRDMPRAEGEAIYRRLYWIRPGLDAVSRLSSGSQPSCSTPASTWGPRSR